MKAFKWKKKRKKERKDAFLCIVSQAALVVASSFERAARTLTSSVLSGVQVLLQTGGRGQLDICSLLPLNQGVFNISDQVSPH